MVAAVNVKLLECNFNVERVTIRGRFVILHSTVALFFIIYYYYYRTSNAVGIAAGRVMYVRRLLFNFNKLIFSQSVCCRVREQWRRDRVFYEA